jgi:SNF2 family DNA or RNA helicase
MNRDNLHNYQLNANDHIIDNNYCGLFLDMGLGKTVSTLTAINELIYEELDVSKVLIIGPKRVAESVWTAEAKKWDHLKHLKIAKVIGSEKQRKAALREKADIYMIGRDNIVWLCGQFGGSMLPFDMLVIDESSSFKSPKSLRFKALKLAQPSFKRVVILTGTPAPNGLIDIWSQVYLLDRGQRLGKTITAYREIYFKPGKRNGAIIYNYDLQQDGESRIHDKISDICMSMKAKDYLDLPKRIDNYIEIQFPADLQQKYDDFERDQVLEMFSDAEDISAINAAALSNKLLQFANGAVYDNEKNYHVIHDLKLEAAEEIVENANGKPVLIAYTYKHDLERLLEKLKKYKPKQLKTDQDINDWNAGKIQVMIMHPASGGHGLNLQAGGNIIVWFGQTWSLELYMQFNARLDRQGQTESVIVNHLVASKTIDQDVIKALANKNTRQEGLMQAIKLKIDKYKKLF